MNAIPNEVDIAVKDFILRLLNADIPSEQFHPEIMKGVAALVESMRYGERISKAISGETTTKMIDQLQAKLLDSFVSE